MKHCKTCDLTMPDEAFYFNRQSEALSTECRECTKKRARANRKVNIEHVRAYDRIRSRSIGRREHLLANSRQWRKNNPIKYRAENSVNNALRDGKITKSPCEVCGREDSHAHHDDYSRPLDVRWLCAVHHQQWHQENGPGLNGDAPANNTDADDSAA